VLKRSIDLDDTFDLTFEEKIVLNAKRLCIVFAGAALILSALHLMSARALGRDTEAIPRLRIVSLARAIDRISFTSASPSVTVTIPTEVIAVVEDVSPI